MRASPLNRVLARHPAHGNLSRKEWMMTKSMSTEIERGREGVRGRPVALGKVNLVLALLGLIVLAGAYRLTFLPEALALLVLTVSLATVREAHRVCQE